MESLVKRYFWVINLVLLAVIAFLAARVINNVVAGEIAALPTNPSTEADPAKALPKRGGSGTDEWAARISERNLFNANPPDLEPDGGVVEGGDAGSDLPPGMVPPPGAPCEESDSNIGYLAAMVAEPSTWSMAVVDDGEADDSRLMKEAQKVGDYTIAAIQSERLVLAKSGAFECVELGKKAAKKRPTKRGYSPPPSAKKADFSKGVKKVGTNRYEIDREMLNEQLADLSQLSRQARVIPHYRDGKPQGFKIVGVRPGSLYSHIGIRSGDVIKAVGDEEITSPNKALELYERLKNSDNVTVDLERRGRKSTLEYEIK